MQATAERAMGGGFRQNSDSELKLKNRCTGSTKPILYLPSANEVWGKLMFSQVFVCPQGEGGWLPSMHHVT